MAPRIELRARPGQHFIYSGRSLLVTNLDGWVTGRDIEGFYIDETRLLSRDEVTVAGQPLTPAGASPVGGAAFFAYAQVPGGLTVPKQAVSVEIARAVSEGMREAFRIQNYHARETARFELVIHLAADFADISEAKEGKRQQSGDVESVWDQDRQEVVFRYAHPQLDRAVAVRVEEAPGPLRCENGSLIATIALAPHQQVELHLAVEPIFDGVRREPSRQIFDGPPAALEKVRQRLKEEAPVLITTNASVARAWQNAIDDLASLPLGLEPGPAAPIAGLPLYQQFFGRDTLTIAWQALPAMPSMMRDTLRLNAAWQGTTIDDWLDEEPGKLIHQARWGPLSLLGIDPFRRYYGDYATPPDFLIMLGQYLAWTNDLETVRELLPAARQAIDWLDRYGDLDGDGFIEYVTKSEKGVGNQGWKDSFDAIVDEYGAIIEAPIATSELQAYWYVGLEQAAAAFFAAGDRAYGVELHGKARALKRRFDQAFWMEDKGFYAMALGPDKQQVRSIASNTGHLLAAGIVPVEKGRRVAQRLMAPDLFSGWGIRTLSTDHPAFDPFSYHRGSVWPVENGTFAFGFARYGCWEELHRLAEGLFAASELFVGDRLPEVLGGAPRDTQHPHPGFYPESNVPQGWSASMVAIVMQSLLGMRPVAPLGVLLVDPHLPAWLPNLRLEGLRVGQTSLDLGCQRDQNGRTRFRVMRREGRVRVVRKPVPQARNASLGGRVKGTLALLPRRPRG
ncbi:MAG: glycogen debranching N-terminal domain-containing protein [Thermomicrobiales bacterium]